MKGWAVWHGVKIRTKNKEIVKLSTWYHVTTDVGLLRIGSHQNPLRNLYFIQKCKTNRPFLLLNISRYMPVC